MSGHAYKASRVENPRLRSYSNKDPTQEPYVFRVKGAELAKGVIISGAGGYTQADVSWKSRTLTYG